MDIIDIVLSKKYTDESLKGIAGTLAGKNCTIKSATKTDGVTTVVFAWTADDGTEKTTTIQVNDGVDGKDTSQDAVLFTEQTLDDSQRAQARENIGAADAARQNILVGSEIGNPIVVDDAFSAPLYGLTLYGKSTQMSTTGAQLFDTSLLKNTSSASVKCNGSDIIITALEDGSYRQTSSVPIGFFEEGDQICIAAEAFPKDNVVIIRDSSGATIANVDLSNEMQKVVTIPANGTYRIILCINKSVSVKAGTVGVFSKLIVNKGNVSKDYEPYTGGAPSPSPSYPQEIENAGDGGSVTVKVTGKNLFPVVTSANLSEINKPDGGVRYGYVFYVPVGSSVAASGNANVSTNCYVGDFDIKTQTYKQKALLVSEKGVANAITLQSGWYVIYAANDYLPSILIKLNGAKIQLEIGAEATAYEPYKPAQTLIIPTPNGLPGIPVSSGGNYTDEKGQQWVCDEVDFKKGVYVQRIGKRTITPKDSFFKSDLSTDDVNYFSLSKLYVYIGTRGEKNVLMSNCFVAGINQGFGASGKMFLGGASSNIVYFSVDAQKYPDAETFKQWAVENGLMFLYQLTDIIETHLTAEGLAAYKALRTYSPTTTVINDAGAGSQLDYQRDVNISIKKLEDAIASMTTT